MRHLNAGRKFDRNSSNRRAMFKNLVANLLAHGQITTTVAKAKEVRRITERVITKAKRVGPELNVAEVSAPVARHRLAVKRDIGKFLPKFAERTVNKDEVETLNLVEHLFLEVAPKFMDRPGGYTRIIKANNRRGDNAPLAIIQLIGFEKVKRVAPESLAVKAPKVRATAPAAAPASEG
ncbi:MAG: 50S ribosomal protein L17 [Deltaproteobacteria bacterium]|nr:50S ribosomal protein L17 [Deltaproteobacteria bacterium]